MTTSPLQLDWLSRLLDMMTVRGRLEIRCAYGAPWQVAYEDSEPGEMPYHVILRGTATLQTPGMSIPRRLQAGDVVVVLDGSRHVLNDGSGEIPAQAIHRNELNLVVSENAGTRERLEMLCGRFVITPPHDRFIREYLPGTLIVRTSNPAHSPDTQTAAQLASLLNLMRAESIAASLGGNAMLNALSAALLTMTLRLASESADTPTGLLAMAAHPRLAPALTAIFNDPAHPWTLPELADLCNMSRATLIRHFQEKVGKSANAILTDLRMTIAANELTSTTLPTEVVAERVGYQSVAAFRRAFAQRMGMTPGDMRRSNQG
ncbi:AraC family transcriptional regulator [Pseudomonas sp. REP124]|uniref:cupin domain-containing protein n=1 Tax=Pseudomonas sp. REP124 TaxID=2875731 RepID=UPI001CCA5B46|nr:cupin domain-containing protein [Pseudomonas sp. REP124]MBZ9780149.1 AraC family transcriptional regulator [Pseudomonas sp. REP124]